jgi:hypothetical protein
MVQLLLVSLHLFTKVDTPMARSPGRSKDHAFQMRVSDDLLRTIDAWRRRQDDKPSRAEAIRRLVGKALRSTTRRPFGDAAKEKAAALASHEIDKVGDRTATSEERAVRKRQLLKGPRELRDDRSKTKPDDSGKL